MTATDYLAPLTSAFLVGFVCALVIHQHRSERRAPDDGLAIFEAPTAADIAADTLARQKRQDRANDIAVEVRGAFLAQMTPDPFASTRADIAGLETTKEGR